MATGEWYVLHYRRDSRSPWTWIGEGTLKTCVALIGSGGWRNGDWWLALVRQDPRSLFEMTN